MTRDEYDQELVRLKADTAALAFKLRLIAVTAGVEVKAYNPTQPRAPKGRSDGGQWVDAGGGSGTATAGKKKPPRTGATTRTEEIVEALKETPAVDADLETVDIQLDGSVFDEAVSEEDQFDVASLGEGSLRRPLKNPRFGGNPRRPLPGSPPPRDPLVEKAKAYLEANPEVAVKIAGAVQVASGAGQLIGGVVLTGVSAAGAATGVGAVPGAVGMTVGIWSAANGVDNLETGWRTIVTGEPQDTRLNQILVRSGVPRQYADAAELTLAAVTTGGIASAAKLTQRELAARAKRGAEIAAAKHLAQKPDDVLGNGQSIWTNPDITVRGERWEVFDNKRTGYLRTKKNFKTFDQFDPKTGTAVSNKTLDLTKPTYTAADKGKTFQKLKGYGDAIADFKDEKNALPGPILRREARVLLPHGKPTPGQILELQAAQEYFNERGMTLKIFYGI